MTVQAEKIKSEVWKQRLEWEGCDVLQVSMGNLELCVIN